MVGIVQGMIDVIPTHVGVKCVYFWYWTQILTLILMLDAAV